MELHRPVLSAGAQEVVAYWRERTGKPRFTPNPAQTDRLEAQLGTYGLPYMLERAQFMAEGGAEFIQMLRAADSWAKKQTAPAMKEERYGRRPASSRPSAAPRPVSAIAKYDN